MEKQLKEIEQSKPDPDKAPILHHEDHYRIYPPYICQCIHCLEQKDLQDVPQKDLSLITTLPEYEKKSGPKLATLQTDRYIRKYGEYMFLLHQLYPKQKQKALQIKIVDCVFFLNKEPQFMIFNKSINSDEMIYSFRKQDFTSQQLRLMFTKRRQNYEIAVHVHLEREKANNSSNNQPYDQNNIKEIRDFKQKQQMSLTNPDLQFVQIKFKEDDALVIQNYAEFNQLLDKRRSDNSWDNIYCIQSCNYLVNRENLTYTFDFEKEKHKQIFKRALEDISQYNKYGYWQSKQCKEEQEYEKHLKSHNLKIYLSYLSYKIHHYIELNSKLKLKRATLYFAADQLNNIRLINAKEVAFLNVHSIEYQDYFQHYADNYSEQEQLQFLNDLQEVKKQNQIETEKKLQKYKKKVDLKTASNRYKIMSEFLQSNTDILMKESDKIDDMIVKLDKKEQKVYTSQAFKQINEKSPYDFYELISLDPKKDMLRFRDKQHILNNFNQESKRFQRDMEYFEYENKNQIQHLRKHAMVDLREKQKMIQQQKENQYLFKNKQRKLQTSQTFQNNQPLSQSQLRSSQLSMNNNSNFYQNQKQQNQQQQQNQQPQQQQQVNQADQLQTINSIDTNTEKSFKQQNQQQNSNNSSRYQKQSQQQQIIQQQTPKSKGQQQYFNASLKNLYASYNMSGQLSKQQSIQTQYQQSLYQSQQNLQQFQQPALINSQSIKNLQQQQQNFMSDQSNQQLKLSKRQSSNNANNTGGGPNMARSDTNNNISSSQFAKNLSTPASKDIKEKRIRMLMTKASAIISFSKQPQYKLKKKGEEFDNALPIMLNIDIK